MVQNSSFMILLVLEDSKKGQEIANLVSSFGYRAQVVASCEDAIGVFEKEIVDLILTDLSLMTLALQGVLEALRTKNKDAGVILLGEREGYIEALESGALDYVSLPLEDIELELKLQRAIGECDLRRQLSTLGSIDKLTGLADEKAFLRVYAREVERTLRQDSRMHVVMVSAETVTDQSVTSIVEILQESIREGVDQAFRLSENDFALTLPETNADQAAEIIQRTLLKSLERGLGSAALAIGCALCRREKGRSYAEIEVECLEKVRDAVLESRKDGGHAAVYRR